MESIRSKQSTESDVVQRLVEELARLVDDRDEIPRLVDFAGIRISIPASGSVSAVWHKVVREAVKRRKVPQLVNQVLGDLDLESDVLIEASAYFTAMDTRLDTAASPPPPKPPLAVTSISDFIEAKFTLRISAIYPCLALQMHTFDPPLLEWELRLAKDAPFERGAAVRLTVTTYIEGFTAETVDTIVLKMPPVPGSGPMDDPATDKAELGVVKLRQRPVFFMERMRALTEITQAQLHTIIKTPVGEVLLHSTTMIWMLARNTSPLAYYDPMQGVWLDMSRYLGAFVTPNHPAVMKFVNKAAQRSPTLSLVGYANGTNEVEAQVAAVYNALVEDVSIRLVNSVHDYNPDTSIKSQRVRLPRESLEEQQGNVVDLSVLFASLLEAISLNSALVVLPSLVIVGWEAEPGSDQWRYLDATKVGRRTFEQAVQFGSTLANAMEKQRGDTGNEAWFRRWPLRELRSKYQIYPLE